MDKKADTKAVSKNEGDDLLCEINDSFGTLLSTISSLKIQLTGLQNQVKGVERLAKKKINKLEKKSKKNRGNKQPSGFANPTKISTKLCKFMELPDGSERARPAVTQYIIKYIKDNKLIDPKNAQIIKPNDKLQNLLEMKENEDPLTYFNIQRHMNKHYLKSE
jgi:chromatin remodeling complex protein RSC6